MRGPQVRAGIRGGVKGGVKGGVDGPTTYDATTTRVVWEGTKLRVEAYPRLMETLERYLQEHNIRSHAVTGARSIAMSQGPDLVLELIDASFY